MSRRSHQVHPEAASEQTASASDDLRRSAPHELERILVPGAMTAQPPSSSPGSEASSGSSQRNSTSGPRAASEDPSVLSAESGIEVGHGRGHGLGEDEEDDNDEVTQLDDLQYYQHQEGEGETGLVNEGEMNEYLIYPNDMLHVTPSI